MLNLLAQVPLFQGIAPDDLEKVLRCLGARGVSYQKNDILLLAGDPIPFLGLVLSGGVKIVKEDFSGDASILTELSASELFGEALVCAGIAHSPFTVLASEDCEILYLDYRKVVGACPAACPFHAKLVENMLRVLAGKNLLLNQKIEILSKRTTREKLLAFFDAQRGASRRFSVPFNREEMARYLCVDRSAMSGELCRMRDEGLIRFHKSAFELLV